jgi:hypothetical protein
MRILFFSTLSAGWSILASFQKKIKNPAIVVLLIKLLQDSGPAGETEGDAG